MTSLISKSSPGHGIGELVGQRDIDCPKGVLVASLVISAASGVGDPRAGRRAVGACASMAAWGGARRRNPAKDSGYVSGASDSTPGSMRSGRNAPNTSLPISKSPVLQRLRQATHGCSRRRWSTSARWSARPSLAPLRRRRLPRSARRSGAWWASIGVGTQIRNGVGLGPAHGARWSAAASRRSRW